MNFKTEMSVALRRVTVLERERERERELFVFAGATVGSQIQCLSSSISIEGRQTELFIYYCVLQRARELSLRSSGYVWPPNSVSIPSRQMEIQSDL